MRVPSDDHEYLSRLLLIIPLLTVLTIQVELMHHTGAITQSDLDLVKISVGSVLAWGFLPVWLPLAVNGAERLHGWYREQRGVDG